MSDVVDGRAPSWLRIVAVLGLLWNLFGVYEYLMTVGVVSGANEAAAPAMPAWATGAFAIAVFGGALGSLGLVMLKRWSKLLLVLSLICVVALDVWSFALSGAASTMGGAEMAVTGAVLAIAVLLAWLSWTADSKGWLS